MVSPLVVLDSLPRRKPWPITPQARRDAASRKSKRLNTKHNFPRLTGRIVPHGLRLRCHIRDIGPASRGGRSRREEAFHYIHLFERVWVRNNSRDDSVGDAAEESRRPFRFKALRPASLECPIPSTEGRQLPPRPGPSPALGPSSHGRPVRQRLLRAAKS